MRPEERGPHLQRHAFADAADDAQHLQLVPGRKAVAALDLHAPRPMAAISRIRPIAWHRVRPRRSLQQVGGIENAPAPPGDLLVRQTVDLVEELLPRPRRRPGGYANRRTTGKDPAPGVDHPVRRPCRPANPCVRTPRYARRRRAARHRRTCPADSSPAAQAEAAGGSIPTIVPMFFTSSLIVSGGIGWRLRYGDTSPRRCR